MFTWNIWERKADGFSIKRCWVFGCALLKKTGGNTHGQNGRVVNPRPYARKAQPMRMRPPSIVLA